VVAGGPAGALEAKLAYGSNCSGGWSEAWIGAAMGTACGTVGAEGAYWACGGGTDGPVVGATCGLGVYLPELAGLVLGGAVGSSS
jgi:hypothetical protein